MDAIANADDSHGTKRRREILNMGIRLWLADPSYVTARRIAHELGMTHGAVLYHFKHSAGLTDALAHYAVQNGESRIIAQLIAQKHKAVAHLSEAQRLDHLKAVG